LCADRTIIALAVASKDLGIPWWIYVGAPGGIHLFRMKTSEDPNIPEYVSMSALGLAAETPAPTCVAVDARRRLLFCVNELDQFAGKPTGAVSAFSVEPASGKLTLLDQRPSLGARPCHLALDRAGKQLLVANQGGSVALFPIGPDGKLGAADVQAHPAKSRPLGVAFSPDDRFAYGCDGLGRVQIFQLGTGKLVPQPAFATKPGARRLVFSGAFGYLLNELDSTVTALACDAKTGQLRALQTLSTLPGYYDGPNRAAELGLHPSGKHLFASNCGHNSIVLFTIDPTKGTLTYVEDQSTYGKDPVHFGMDTPGKHLAVANRDSGSILILRAPESARVKPAGNVVKMPGAACAVFLAPA
jgi:6-phosphogluconolactonase